MARALCVHYALLAFVFLLFYCGTILYDLPCRVLNTFFLDFKSNVVHDLPRQLLQAARKIAAPFLHQPRYQHLLIAAVRCGRSKGLQSGLPLVSNYFTFIENGFRMRLFLIQCLMVFLRANMFDYIKVLAVGTLIDEVSLEEFFLIEAYEDLIYRLQYIVTILIIQLLSQRVIVVTYLLIILFL